MTRMDVPLALLISVSSSNRRWTIRGGQPQRKLVADEQGRLRHQCPPHCHHLLLAPRQQPSRLAQKGAELGKQLQVLLQRIVDTIGVATAGRTAQQVFLDRQIGEELASFGNLSHPCFDDCGALAAQNRLAAQSDAALANPPLVQVQQAGYRPYQGGFARTVGSQNRYEPPAGHGDVHVVQSGYTPVGHLQPLDAQVQPGRVHRLVLVIQFGRVHGLVLVIQFGWVHGLLLDSDRPTQVLKSLHMPARPVGLNTRIITTRRPLMARSISLAWSLK